MHFTKPRRLHSGDTVAIVSPSWGGPSVFPHVYEHGLKILEEWGLVVKEYPTARMDAAQSYANPRARAEDLNRAFADPDVNAIITSIGGEDSVRILPFLDKQVIANNPKIFMGFSDTTTMHVFANSIGLVSLYGPSIMAGFSQMHCLPTAFRNHVYTMLFEPTDCYEYHPYLTYCDGYPDWRNREDVGKVNVMKVDDGWHWLQGTGITEGPLFGGCIEVLEMMKATDFWPPAEFWKGKVLFLETSEEKPPVSYVGHVLRNYGMLGVFDNINALIFSRARDYSADEKLALEHRIVTIVSEEFGNNALPIVANFDVGHTDPQLILPLGVNARVDCSAQSISLTESWLM